MSIIEEALRYIKVNPVYGENGETKKALFLLGYLISEIGSAQRSKGLGENILNKINFRGMNKEHILRLVNQVFEYMKIYDLFYPDNKKVLGIITENLDNALNKWETSPEASVYFILSGYAFTTSRRIKLSIEKKSEKEVINE